MKEEIVFFFLKHSLSEGLVLDSEITPDWEYLFSFGEKQSITGILFRGVEKLYNSKTQLQTSLPDQERKPSF